MKRIEIYEQEYPQLYIEESKHEDGVLISEKLFNRIQKHRQREYEIQSILLDLAGETPSEY